MSGTSMVCVEGHKTRSNPSPPAMNRGNAPTAAVMERAVVRAVVKAMVVAVAIVAMSLGATLPAAAQSRGDDRPSFFVPEATGPITIDGQPDEPAWAEAPKVYLARRGGLQPLRPVIGRVLWDDQYLYIAFHAYDTDVRGEMTERDDWLWEDGDVVEAFFYFGEPGTDLLEVELNPQGAFLDLRFPQGDPNWPEPVSWRWEGAKWAVHVDGTLNDNTTPDRGWTAEIALPWAGLPADVADQRPSRMLLAAYNRDKLHDGRISQELTYWPLLRVERFNRSHEYANVRFVPRHEPGQHREGFVQIVAGEPSDDRFYARSYRGAVPQWRMTDEASDADSTRGRSADGGDNPWRIAWRTAPAPESFEHETHEGSVSFGFVADSAGPAIRHFDLHADGERVLSFDIDTREPEADEADEAGEAGPADDRAERWSAAGVTLERHRRSGGAYYVLTLPRDRLTPGEAVELEVRPGSATPGARFFLKAWTDAALMEHHHDGRWRNQR